MKNWRRKVALMAAAPLAAVACSAVGAQVHVHPIKPWTTPTGWGPAGSGAYNAVQQGNHYQVEYLNKNGQFTRPIFDFWVEPEVCNPNLAGGQMGYSAELWFHPKNGNRSCKVIGTNIFADNNRDVGDIVVYPRGFFHRDPEVYIKFQQFAGVDSFRFGN